MIAPCKKVSSLFDVSVDRRVPEQSLVTITPEEVLVSDILELHLLWTFQVWDLGVFSTVVGVLHLHKVCVDRSQANGRKSNQKGDFLPQAAGT